MQPASPATTSAQALTNVQNYQNGMQTPTQDITQANQQLGVGQAQQTVQGLQGAINNTTNLLNQVTPSIEGRTQNSLVTSAQATGQIENAEAPLQTDLQQNEQSYNTANSNYTNLETQATNLADANQESQSNQLSYLQSVYQDLYTQEQNAAAQQQQAHQNAVAQQEFEEQLSEEEQAADSQDAASDAELQALEGNSSAGSSSSGSSGTSSAPIGSYITARPTKTKSTRSSSLLGDIASGVKYNAGLVGKALSIF